MRELRCDGNKLHGLIVDEDGPAQGIVEFRCDSKFCGKAPGCVVLHRFDLRTGDCSTRRYKEPPTPDERRAHGSSNQRPPVRTP